MAVRQEDFNIEVGTGIIKVFKRIDIENFRIFSEFIDNSLQSFIDHRDVLVDKLHVQKCVIDISWSPTEIVITDNCFGMEREAFERALRLNAPAANYSKGSLSKYGMGLKYAASNLGSIYEIESSQYGSKNKYKTVVDVNRWINENPKSNPVQIMNDFDENKHFTIITVKNLYQKFSEAQMKKTIKKLGVIYQKYIDKKELAISINKNNVAYSEPDLQVDENGSQILEFIDGKFNFEGKTYEYSGWLGVLKTGNVADAGFSLMQNKRVIEMNFRPKEIFGLSNTFMYQRIVGEITFLGDNWEVRVNKDGLAWVGTGLRELFIEKLAADPKVKKIAKIAKETRKKDNVNFKLTSECKNCSIEGTKSLYLINERVNFKVIPIDGFVLKSVKIGGEELTPTEEGGTEFAFTIDSSFSNKIVLKVVCVEDIAKPQNQPSSEKGGEVVISLPSHDDNKKPDGFLTKTQKIEKAFVSLKNINVPGEDIKSNPNIDTDGTIVIEYKNTKYAFAIDEQNFPDKQEWLSITTFPYPRENTFGLEINYKSGFLRQMFLSEDTKIVIINLAISIALSVITGASSGVPLSQSKVLLTKLNEIIDNTK